MLAKERFLVTDNPRSSDVNVRSPEIEQLLLTKFLKDTLEKPAADERRRGPYLFARCFQQGTEDSQLLALQLLRDRPSPLAAQSVAAHLLAVIITGDNKYNAIVPFQQGKREEKFNTLIAVALGKLMRVPVVGMITTLKERAFSGKVEGMTLLVADRFPSEDHIAHACRAIHETGIKVVAMSWIGP